MKRWIKIALCFASALAIIGLGIVGLVIYKDQKYVQSEPYMRKGKRPARVVVVYYSRSGHTESAVRELARVFDADVVQIECSSYPRSLAGWWRAARDARRQSRHVPISHPQVDLGRYDLIVLGSPIWFFHPAPPLRSFVEDHRFHSRPVLLVTTGNTSFDKDKIKGFAALVEQHGGRFVDHIFLRRGRVFWQKTPAQINTDLLSALKARGDALDRFRPAP